MVEEHQNATAYRNAANAFRAWDREALEALIADDVVWHLPRGVDLLGRTQVLDWLARLPDLGFRLREHDVFGNDHHVCALSYMAAHRAGVDVETRVVSIFHYENGRMTERWFYPEDLAAWDRIFEAPPAEGGHPVR